MFTCRAIFWVLSLIPIFLVFLFYYMTSTTGKSYQGTSCALSKEEKIILLNAKTHITNLSVDIGERNLVKYENLRQTANYIEDQMNSLGLTTKDHTFLVQGKKVRNIEATIGHPTSSSQVVIVGAHYDSVIGSPGADDNASGVAALLEIIRLLKNHSLKHTVRFVAFVNEEPPYFKTEFMGSSVYAKNLSPLEIKAMISIDMIGYYLDTPNSQQHPLLFNFFYPNTGNFLAFVSNLTSKSLLQQTLSSFRYYTPIPSEGIAAFASVPGIDWSDHQSFWKENIPAILVTDTGPYRYPYYHSYEDSIDKINFIKLAQVINGLAHVIKDLANDRPLPYSSFSLECK